VSALSGEVSDVPVCGMKRSTEAAWERAMKIQEVMLRAMAKRIALWQAAEIIGISCRQMRRWLRAYQERGYEGLRDRRRGRKRVPLKQVEEVLGLIRTNILISMCATFARMARPPRRA
jgi:transposase